MKNFKCVDSTSSSVRVSSGQRRFPSSIRVIRTWTSRLPEPRTASKKEASNESLKIKHRQNNIESYCLAEIFFLNPAIFYRCVEV